MSCLLNQAVPYEPLQLLPLGIAFPIGPGHVQELEGPDRPGAGHVGPAAEIDELALPVERDLAMVGQAGFDVLDLQALAQVLAELQGLVAVHFHPLERLVFLDDPGHFGLDLGEILFGKPPLGLEIVVEAVLDRGAKGQLDAVVEPHHRPGHDVGTGVPHDVQGLGVATGDQPQGDLAFFGQEGVGADDLAIDLAATVALARRGPISAAISMGRTRRVYSRTLPSGKLTLSMFPSVERIIPLRRMPVRAARRYKGRWIRPPDVSG